MTGIILAGGRNSRFGENKAFMDIAGRPLIERTVEVLGRIFNEIIIVSNQPADYKYLGLKVVEDIIPDKGPLSGIHAGLANSTSLYSFVVACDMPFLDGDLIRSMKESVFNCDVFAPRIHGRIEPLHAFYSRGCLPQIEKHLHSNKRAVMDFIKEVRVEYADFDEVLPFVNINTREEWKCYSTVLAAK